MRIFPVPQSISANYIPRSFPEESLLISPTALLMNNVLNCDCPRNGHRPPSSISKFMAVLLLCPACVPLIGIQIGEGICYAVDRKVLARKKPIVI